MVEVVEIEVYPRSATYLGINASRDDIPWLQVQTCKHICSISRFHHSSAMHRLYKAWCSQKQPEHRRWKAGYHKLRVSELYSRREICIHTALSSILGSSICEAGRKTDTLTSLIGIRIDARAHRDLLEQGALANVVGVTTQRRPIGIIGVVSCLNLRCIGGVLPTRRSDCERGNDCCTCETHFD